MVRVEEPGTPRLRISIVLIGDELLDGYVADRNAHWLAGRLSELGIPLDRITIVPDEPVAIGEALSLELARPRPRLVVTSGGIGTTHDDLTMAAVAAYLGQPLVPQPEIAARIDTVVERAAAAGSPIDDDQVAILHRMALAPAEGRVLEGSTAMVPGVVVDLDGGANQSGGASVAILPGVPSQFREIVEQALEPEFLAGRGVEREIAEFTHDHPESAFTRVLDSLHERYPELAIGSYPGFLCVIRVKGPREQVAEAMKALRAHAERLESDPVAVRRRDSWRARHG